MDLINKKLEENEKNIKNINEIINVQILIINELAKKMSTIKNKINELEEDIYGLNKIVEYIGTHVPNVQENSTDDNERQKIFNKIRNLNIKINDLYGIVNTNNCHIELSSSQ